MHVLKYYQTAIQSQKTPPLIVRCKGGLRLFAFHLFLIIPSNFLFVKYSKSQFIQTFLVTNFLSCFLYQICFLWLHSFHFLCPVIPFWRYYNLFPGLNVVPLHAYNVTTKRISWKQTDAFCTMIKDKMSVTQKAPHMLPSGRAVKCVVLCCYLLAVASCVPEKDTLWFQRLMQGRNRTWVGLIITGKNNRPVIHHVSTKTQLCVCVCVWKTENNLFRQMPLRVWFEGGMCTNIDFNDVNASGIL